MLKDRVWLQSFFEDFGKKPSRAWLVLLIFTLALQVLSIWNLKLSGRDSPRVAGIAREMAVTSNYLIPRLNGEDFLEYPPLGYWPVAFTLSMSEKPPDFLAFLPIILLGTGTVLITFLIGKELAGERIGLMAGFILSTMPAFISYHRHFRVDPALLFFITLSLYGFVAGYNASPSPLPSPLEGEGKVGGKRVLFIALFYLGMAGAFLSKGIIGAAIPLGTVVVFLIIKKDLTAIIKLLLRPEFLLFLLPVLLWVVGVWRFEGPDIIKEVMRQSLWRFLSPSADHAKPFYYYFTRVFLAPMPWTLLFLVLLWYRWGPTQSREPLRHGSLFEFALAWSLIVFIGLSLSSAKRTLYLGPIYPPFALLAALGWDRLREKFPKVKRSEAYGLIVVFFVYVGIYPLVITPMESKKSLRPVFKAVSSQRTNGPIYLVNPSETTRGASFFYLGKRIPVLNEQDLLLGKFEDLPGTTLVIDSLCDDNQLLSNLRSKGYSLILQKKKYGKEAGICVYSNSS
jgi:4-amino-4-deoxy-L-arabinose transferase-like glycosyltransferase